MASLKFGSEKKSRFPYWVIPTVIFMFGVGMFVGRALESDLTLMELRNERLTVADVVDRLWPRRNEPVAGDPARTAAQRTEVENRLKTENARLMTEKDALVEKAQAVAVQLRARDQSIKELREEVNKLAQSNQQLVGLSQENEKLRQQVELEKETAREQEKARKQVAATARPAVEKTQAPRRQKTTTVVPAARAGTESVALTRSKPEPVSQGPSYQVLRRTPILRNPADNAQILYYLNAGRRVQVSGIVDGKFMRVQYSRTGNPPGYVVVNDVMPLP